MPHRVLSIFALVVVFVLPISGQNPAQTQPGIVVEKVSKYFEGDQAGLQEGDILLSWSRGDQKGKLDSPFDLSGTEVEQAPPGRVTLAGLRGAEERSWTLGPDDWGLKARPNLQGMLLDLCREGENLEAAGKMSAAAERWRAAATQAQKSASPPWLAAWLLFHAAGELTEKQMYKASDGFYQAAAQQSGSEPKIAAQILLAWGDSFQKRSNWDNAEKYYQQAIAESRKMDGENAVEAVSLYNLGLVSFKRGDLNKAEEYCSRALALEEKLAPGGLRAALDLDRLGTVATSRSQLDKAEDYYRQAMAIQQKLAPKGLGLALSLDSGGDVSWYRGDLNKAEEYYREGLVIRQRLAPDGLEVAQSLQDLGDIADHRGDLTKAEEYYREGLVIRQRLAPESLDVATSLASLGLLARERGNLDTAEDFYKQALAIRQTLAPNSLAVAASINLLGTLARLRGNLDEAEAYFLRNLEIARNLAAGSLREASALNDLALVARDRGDLDKADEDLEQSLAIRERIAATGPSVAIALQNLGIVATERGDAALAEQYLLRSLAIQEKLAPESLAVAMALNDLGFTLLRGGDLTNADAYLQRSLAIYRKAAPDSLEKGHCLNNLGWVARERGNLDFAERYEREALAIRQKIAPGSWLVAWSFNSLADIAVDRGDLSAAEGYYRQALRIREKLAPGNREHAETLAALAAVVRKSRRPDEATQLYAKAIDALESQTARLGGSTQVRSSFRASHSDYYREYIDLLIEENKAEAAFQILERSRARALLELMAEAHVEIRQGVEAGLLVKERSLQESIRAKSDRRLQLPNGEHQEDQVAALDREIRGLLAQYEEVEGQIRESSPGYAALTQPQPLSAKEIQQQVLDGDSLLLEYSLGAERSHLFVLSASTFKTYELPKRAQIEESARRVYRLLTAQNRRIYGETPLQRRARLRQASAEFPRAAAELSRMVLGPAASELENKRLLIVSDGALAYIPFALLTTPATIGSTRPVPLIVEHEIVNLPSASVVAALRQQEAKRKPPTRAVAVLADPVFSADDSRVIGRHATIAAADEKERSTYSADLLLRSAGDVGLERHGGAFLDRLRFTRLEAEAIAAVAPAEESMQALDFQASRETATSPDLGQYRIIHFATHGLLNSQHPELSGLVFSLVDKHGRRQNGFLELQDIYNLSLSADLVVLSACETGLGKEVDGEGLVGLARGFMYAGASRVVASLWQVDDQATAQVMTYFYKNMLAEGMRPAAALRAAQAKMWKEPRWHDPYFWAAFQIQGEWN